ncbi:hypothetical protein BC332_09944 [Capsicum chinense]|nr:hypothetical protein BC332_09944 [Capsicum chinense]
MAVDFMNNNLTQLLMDEKDLITEIEDDEVESLTRELNSVRVFLKDANRSRSSSRSEILKHFVKLYHLRYIALSSDSSEILPKFMEDLWNLQTLIILTQQNILDIQADICNMPQLRHLYTNASAKLQSSAAVKSDEQGDLITWKTSSNVFRSLERLHLRRLDKLKEVPIELADIRNLQKMERKYTTTTTAVESAKNRKAKRV